MVQVAGLGPAPCFFLLFSVLFFFPHTRLNVWVGVDGFTLCPALLFLRSFLLVFFLGIIAFRPRDSGIRYLPNK